MIICSLDALPSKKKETKIKNEIVEALHQDSYRKKSIIY